MKNKYELFYDTGGHGGPYEGFNDARNAAKRLLEGCKSMERIHVINRKEWDKNLGIMKASFVVKKKKTCFVCGKLR